MDGNNAQIGFQQVCRKRANMSKFQKIFCSNSIHLSTNIILQDFGLLKQLYRNTWMPLNCMSVKRSVEWLNCWNDSGWDFTQNSCQQHFINLPEKLNSREILLWFIEMFVAYQIPTEHFKCLYFMNIYFKAPLTV